MKLFAIILSALTVTAVTGSNNHTIRLRVVEVGGENCTPDDSERQILSFEESANEWARNNDYNNLSTWEELFDNIICSCIKDSNNSETCTSSSWGCQWNLPCHDQYHVLVEVKCKSFQCVKNSTSSSWSYHHVDDEGSNITCASPKTLSDECKCECNQLEKSNCTSGRNWDDNNCSCSCPQEHIPCSTVDECKCVVNNHMVNECYHPVCSNDTWTQGTHKGCPSGYTELNGSSPLGCCESSCHTENSQSNDYGTACYNSANDDIPMVSHSYAEVNSLCMDYNNTYSHHHDDDGMHLWENITGTQDPPLATGKFCVNVKKFLTSGSHMFRSAKGLCEGKCSPKEDCMSCNSINGYNAYVLMEDGLPSKCVRDMYGYMKSH